MSRKFIATVLAGALVVTGFTTAPARADGNDLAKAIAGIAAVAIIAKALDDERKDKARRHAPAKKHSVKPTRHSHGYVAPRPLPQRVARKQLPGHCMVRVETRRGVQRAFAGQCLQRSYRHADRLPRACAMPTRGRGHNRTFYEAGCLRSYGYSMARR